MVFKRDPAANGNGNNTIYPGAWPEMAHRVVIFSRKADSESCAYFFVAVPKLRMSMAEVIR